jgi:hypothetical protein
MARQLLVDGMPRFGGGQLPNRCSRALAVVKVGAIGKGCPFSAWHAIAAGDDKLRKLK